MGNRAFNFNAGPAALPLEALERAQKEFVDYRGIGMSVMEISHRSKEYEAINAETQALFKELLRIPDGYKVLFLQGGASTQFAMIPMNFLKPGKTAGYVMTGSWADKALKEAKLIGDTYAAASSADDNFTRIPRPGEIRVDPNAAYVHITSNETIGGIQYANFPDTGSVPLIADMSSDILSRPIDVKQFGLIYAGAQKNLGPSGVTVVIVRKDLLAEAPKHLPTMLRYTTHAENDSLYNTPPAYSVYMVKLVLEWMRERGGIEAMAAYNAAKTDPIYEAIDASGGFYRGVAQADSRSRMNITWRMASEDLEKAFVKESEKEGFVGLKGHRSVGGLRASTYNAVTEQSCQALVAFMKEFQRKHA